MNKIIRKNIDNKFIKEMLLQQYDHIYNYITFMEGMDSDIINLLRGATGQLSSTKRPSEYKVFKLLQSLNEINFNTVSDTLNKKSMVLYDKPYSDSYITQWVACLTCASQSIYHYLLTR